jgi:hypothetical protein
MAAAQMKAIGADAKRERSRRTNTRRKDGNTNTRRNVVIKVKEGQGHLQCQKRGDDARNQ